MSVAEPPMGAAAEADRRRLDDKSEPTPCMVCGGPCPIGASVRPLRHHAAGYDTWWRVCGPCERDESLSAIITGVTAAAVNDRISVVPALDPADPALRLAVRDAGTPFYAIDGIGMHRNPHAAPLPDRWAFDDAAVWARQLAEASRAYRLRPSPGTGLPCPRCGRSKARGWVEVSGGGPGQRLWVCAAEPGEHRHDVARADGYCGGVRQWAPKFLGRLVPGTDAYDLATRRSASARLPYRYFGDRDRAALEAAGIARRVRGVDSSDVVGDFAERVGWWAPEEDPRWGTEEWGEDWQAWEYLGDGAAERLAEAHRVLTNPAVIRPAPDPEPPVTVEAIPTLGSDK